MTRRVGLLLNRTRCAYSHALGDALEAAAAKSEMELEYLYVNWAESERELGIDELETTLEQARSVEGLVMLSGVFSHGLKNLAKFTQRWWPRPAVSIGYRLPLIPSVVVDNRAAMQMATEHLIVAHERRNILFIRGRSDSQEASDRYFGFRKALGEHGVIHDSALVLTGDFTRRSAVDALSQLPKELHFDALIASNDEMALGAMSELERMGRKIPDDVAVIGFDDVPAAAKARTPLSTMAQPFDALAKTALQLIGEQCEGNSVPPRSAVALEFVQRASCGCKDGDLGGVGGRHRMRTSPRGLP